MLVPIVEFIMMMVGVVILFFFFKKKKGVHSVNILVETLTWARNGMMAMMVVLGWRWGIEEPIENSTIIFQVIK